MKRKVHSGRILDFFEEEVQLPNGAVATLEFAHHPGAAAAVPLHEDMSVTMLRQYRHAVGGWIWEIPAGKLDFPDEEPLDCARRELAEEAGLAASEWKKLGSILTTPGFCDEVIHLYLARGLSDVPVAHERDEVIEVHRMALAEAVALIPTEEIRDTKTVAALQATVLLLAKGSPGG